MFDVLFKIFLRNSPCRALQKVEANKFKLNGKSLEIGNQYFNQKSFFNDFKIQNKDLFFADMKRFKSKNFINLNLEKKNNVNIKFDNIVIFNVFEHIFDSQNAISELKKMVKTNGQIIVSTPFIYRYHEAPLDYNRPTVEFYEKLSKKNKLKIIYKKSLGFGPFFAAYSIIHNVLRFFYPLNVIIAFISILIDSFLSFFLKDLKKLYPICNFVILKKI